MLAAGALSASCLLVVADLSAPVAFYANAATSDRDAATSGLAVINESPSSPSSANTVRALKERSGLTWDQFAAMFGVSRRAVHGWASGARLNAHHSESLALLGELVDQVGVSDSPASTRAALLSSEFATSRGSTALNHQRTTSPLDRIAIRSTGDRWRTGQSEQIAISDAD